MRHKERNHETRTLIVVGALTLLLVFLAHATSLAAQSQPAPPAQPAPRAQSQTSAGTYASPADAVTALIDASRKGDVQTVESVFGPGSKDVVESGDPVADKLALQRFVAAYDKKSALVPI